MHSSNFSYAILGTGGVGGYFGGRLALCGHNVKFLFHSDYDHVQAHGLVVHSHKGDFHLPQVQAFDNVANMGPADVVLVCLKTTNELLLTSLLPPLVHNDSIVILIQNGIGVEDEVTALLATKLPHIQLVAGLAFICSEKIAPGEVNHQFYGSINLAPFSVRPQNLQCLQAIAQDFIQSGVPINILDYLEARWKKAVWNMPFNGLSVVRMCQTDALVREPNLALVRQLMLEVIAAAQALGAKNITPAFAEQMIESTQRMPPYSPSMRVDFDHHRPMEVEFLYRRPLALAAKAGAPMTHMAEVMKPLLDNY